MYLHGTFPNQAGDTIAVHILTNHDHTDERIIGTPESGIYFTDDPIDIESQVSDTFEPLQCHQATLRLLVTNYQPQLFAPNTTDTIVNIYQADTCIFAGYIEPRVYSQDYNDTLDQLELTLIDIPTAIQDQPYLNITTPTAHATALATADQVTLLDIIRQTIGAHLATLDILHPTTSIPIYYDGSKCLTYDDTLSAAQYRIFQHTAISQLLPLGQSYDDTWSQDTLLSAILRYLNLHIIQLGLRFYIYSWETIRATTPTKWANILGDTTDDSHTTQPQAITIATPIVTDTDTQITLADIYNHLQLTCKTTDYDTLIQSPLDDDLLTSTYRHKQPLLTEIYADTAYSGLPSFEKVIHGTPIPTSHVWTNDWYIQVMNNPQWAFPAYIATDLTPTEANIAPHAIQGAWQENVPHFLAAHHTAALLAIGRVTNTYDTTRNQETDTKIELTNYLYISVNGNTSDTNPTPTPDDLLTAAPVATYNGAVAGGLLSPTDDKTTNYIVISGKIALQPILPTTDAYNPLANDDPNLTIPQGVGVKNPTYIYKWVNNTVPIDKNTSKGYKTRKYYTNQAPYYDPTTTPSTITPDTTRNERNAHTFVPFDPDASPQYYPFHYSAIGDSADHIRKLGVIACMLIVGTKCLVEVGTSGTPTDYQWQPYRTRDLCQTDDEYYAQSFTIGFDPETGDNLIGKEYSIQNNITHPLGLDTEGTAIPIRQSDHLSGRVTFHILGPANLTWSQVTRRHPTWFRHTKWATDTIPLMAHVQNVVLKSFEIKLYTDNAHLDTYTTDSDIIYTSDTDETFHNPHDDIQFDIHSALTSEECYQLGTTTALHLSTIIDISQPATPSGLQTIYDVPKQQQVKPEQDYIDSYYTEYHRPHILLTQSITDHTPTATNPPTTNTPTANLITPFAHYTHPALTRTFYPIAINRNLITATAQLTLKEL